MQAQRITSKQANVPAKRERIARLTDRETAEEIRQALQCKSASGFVSTIESEDA